MKKRVVLTVVAVAVLCILVSGWIIAGLNSCKNQTTEESELATSAQLKTDVIQTPDQAVAEEQTENIETNISANLSDNWSDDDYAERVADDFTNTAVKENTDENVSEVENTKQPAHEETESVSISAGAFMPPSGQDGSYDPDEGEWDLID